jgi:ABC-type lipoprotein release transport system permease subunit
MLNDLRLAIRALARTPGFSVVWLAGWIPARRAAGVDPAIALRQD